MPVNDSTASVAELLLNGLVSLQEEQAARAEDPQVREGVERWFADSWPHRSILGSGDYDVPRGGASNEMLAFDVTWAQDSPQRTQRFLLRFEGDDEAIAPPASDSVQTSTELEYLVQSALHQTGTCPTAPLVGIEPTGDVLGRPFYVMQHVPGRVPPTAGQNVAGFVCENLGPEQRATLMRHGLAAVADFHRLDWEGAGLTWLHNDPSTAVTRQLALYREYIQRYLRGAEHPILMGSLDWLDAHVPEPVPLALTWGDARPGNLMFDDACEVAAVLDWELAALLPPGVDVGHWMLADFMVHESEGTQRLPGFPTRADQLAIYEACLGSEVRDLGFWEVFAGMKSAYVFIRVVRRMQDKGVMPPDGDALFYDNFAVRYLEERTVKNAPGLLGR
ncbi:MAG: phosphotransferase family protein [Solirubrobacterales bacterium]|nr:phosphotransferase family protein [Solirubrobacterales bacterium]